MAMPRNTSVTIDDYTFNAYSTHFEIGTHHDGHGMPSMGTTRTAINVVVDVHDAENMKFDVLNKLFELSQNLTRDKIKVIKLEYWMDDAGRM